MAHPRRIYYRKKNKKIIIEGKKNSKTIYLWTLPNPEMFIRELCRKASYFPKDKANKIMQILVRLDYKTRKDDNGD